jgi:hypothetical protein
VAMTFCRGRGRTDPSGDQRIGGWRPSSSKGDGLARGS